MLKKKVETNVFVNSAKGYFIDVLGEPLTCANLRQYGGLLIVDPEGKLIFF